MDAGSIVYEVEVETAALTRGEKQADEALNRLDGNLKKTERSAQATTRSMSGLAKAVAAAISVQALRNMGNLVQMHQAMAERVEMATRSTEEYDIVQRRLLETAAGTYRALEEAQELYIRTADSLRSMGYETGQALDVVDSLSYAFVTNTASTQRAEAATTAFSKALNTGRVSADQWESILAAIPTVIADIADASGRTEEEVRKLGAEGKLSAGMLTEGLRESLEATKAAADGMSNDLTDAAVRVRGALRDSLVAIEGNYGALQSVTEGIILAANAMQDFANDAERMEGFLQLTTVAGASLASILAGRLLMSIYASTAATVASVRAAYDKAQAERLAADALVRRTVAERNAALQAMRAAQADFNAARGTAAHATALVNLTRAKERYMAATTAASAAQVAANRVMTLGTLAANGLRTALGFLGGPAGLVLLVASAILTMGRNAKIASSDLQELIGSVETLGTRTLEYRRIELEKALAAQSKEVEKARKRHEFMARQVYRGANAQEVMAERTARTAAEVEAAEQKEREYADAVKATSAELERRASGADIGPQTPDGWEPPSTDPVGGSSDEVSAAEKYNQTLRDRIELEQKTGLARAKLEAIQRLGADATQEERDEAEHLVEQLYNLEKAQEANEQATKAREKAADDAVKADEANEAAIQSLREALIDATSSELDLIEVQALRALNADATASQVEQVKALAAATRQLRQEELDRELKQEAIDADPRTAAADQYAQQLEQYRAFKEAELLTDQQYLELQNAAHTQYEQERLAAQEEIFRAQSASNEFLMGSIDALGQASTNVISGLLSGTMNTKEAMQSLANTILNHAIGALVEMGVQHVKSVLMGQAASTAAAATAVATGATMATAYAPAAAAASLASFGANAPPAMAGMASTYGLANALSVAGGRQHGGPVNAGSLYKINEGGKPEVFNAANGSQYMMANQRGHVVSNADATGSGGTGGNTTVNQTFNVNGDVSDETVQMMMDTARRTLEAVMVDANRNGPIMQTIRKSM